MRLTELNESYRYVHRIIIMHTIYCRTCYVGVVAHMKCGRQGKGVKYGQGRAYFVWGVGEDLGE